MVAYVCVRCDLVVVGMTAKRDLKLSRPCSICVKMMKFVGIRRVYYSLPDSTFMCERVRDMRVELISKTRKIVPARMLHLYTT